MSDMREVGRVGYFRNSSFHGNNKRTVRNYLKQLFWNSELNITLAASRGELDESLMKRMVKFSQFWLL